MDVGGIANMDAFFGESVTPLYKEKRRVTPQLITLVLVSFGYCTAVGFRNAMSVSFLTLSSDFSESQHTINYQAYHEEQKKRNDSHIYKHVLEFLWIYTCAITLVATIVVLLLSIIIGRFNANQYVEQYRVAFLHWKDQQNSLQAINKQRMTKKKLWLDSLVLNRVWGETFTSARGKALQIFTACLAFTTGWAWKDAIAGLIIYMYSNIAVQLVSLWIYTILVTLVAIILTGAIYREFNNMTMSLKRSLESYRSWTEMNKEKKKAPKIQKRQSQNSIELVLKNKEVQISGVIETAPKSENIKEEKEDQEDALKETKEEEEEEDGDKEEEEEEEEKEKQETNLSQVEKARDRDRIKMFIKEEILYRIFPFLETMMTLLSAWAFRDTMNTTLSTLGAKPDTAVGASLLWAYAITILVAGMFFAVAMGRRMQKYSRGIRTLRRKSIRFEYLYRVQRHQKEYRHITMDKKNKPISKKDINTHLFPSSSHKSNNDNPTVIATTTEKEVEWDVIDTNVEKNLPAPTQDNYPVDGHAKTLLSSQDTEMDISPKIDHEIRGQASRPSISESDPIKREKSSRPSISEHEMSRALSADGAKRYGGQASRPSVSVNEWYDHFRYHSSPNVMAGLPALLDKSINSHVEEKKENSELPQKPVQMSIHNSIEKKEEETKSIEVDTKNEEKIAQNKNSKKSILLMTNYSREREIKSEKLIQEMDKLEAKVLEFKLKKHACSLLVASFSFTCGMALYDAVDETFQQALSQRKIGTFWSMLILAVSLTVFAIFLVAYLDQTITKFHSFFTYLDRRSRQKQQEQLQQQNNDPVQMRLLDPEEQENVDDNNINHNNRKWETWIMKTLPFCTCCVSSRTSDREKQRILSVSDTKLKKERRNQMRNIEVTLMFGRYVTSIISLVTALAYAFTLQTLFELAFKGSSSRVWSLWVFVCIEIVASIAVATGLARLEPKKKNLK